MRTTSRSNRSADSAHHTSGLKGQIHCLICTKAPTKLIPSVSFVPPNIQVPFRTADSPIFPSSDESDTWLVDAQVSFQFVFWMVPVLLLVRFVCPIAPVPAQGSDVKFSPPVMRQSASVQVPDLHSDQITCESPQVPLCPRPLACTPLPTVCDCEQLLAESGTSR